MSCFALQRQVSNYITLWAYLHTCLTLTHCKHRFQSATRKQFGVCQTVVCEPVIWLCRSLNLIELHSLQCFDNHGDYKDYVPLVWCRANQLVHELNEAMNSLYWLLNADRVISNAWWNSQVKYMCFIWTFLNAIFSGIVKAYYPANTLQKSLRLGFIFNIGGFGQTIRFTGLSVWNGSQL